jgi:hypothetical protein
MVDEDEYEALVERRRNEDDFVVDDSKNSAAPVAYAGVNFHPVLQTDLDTMTTARSTLVLEKMHLMVINLLRP